MTETVRFPVRGMTCTACVSRITRELRRLPGVSDVRIRLADESATVRREPASVSDAALAAAVQKAGYTAEIEALERLPSEPPTSRPWLMRLLGRA